MNNKQNILIGTELSAQVLTVGLQYKNHRGGIGGVIDTYSKYFQVFNFVSVYRPQRFKILIFPYYIGAILKLIRILITDRKIKIVHIHGAAKGSLLRKYIVFLISKHIFRKIVIYHSHGSELETFYLKSNGFIKKWIRSFFSNVDLIICLSIKWKVFFEEKIHAKKILILENIVEHNDYVKHETKQAQLPFTMLFLGAIGERKGIFDLLSVLADNKAYFNKKLILLVGGNGDINRFKEFVNVNGIGNIVKFEGWVSGEKKKDLMLKSDIYILPSYNEGLPLSILEAMSYGMPIISTPVGGTPEVVKPRLNGLLVIPGNKEEIFSALQWFINNPDLILEYGNNSKKIVEPYYAYNVIPKLSNIYNDLLS